METAVASVFSSNTLIHSNAETVLEQLNRCDVVHFACHGTSSHIDPFDSSLILQKSTTGGLITDKLTVRQIVDAHLERATIAYLSACSTADTRKQHIQRQHPLQKTYYMIISVLYCSNLFRHDADLGGAPRGSLLTENCPRQCSEHPFQAKQAGLVGCIHPFYCLPA